LEFGESQTKPHKHIRWFEIHDWFGKLKVHEPATEYLVNAFKSFLEAKGMSIEKVNWEYINGVPFFNNLINMNGASLESLNIPLSKTHPKAVSRDTRGFYLKDNEFWCGVHYSSHMAITFELIDRAKFNKERLENQNYELRQGNKRLSFRLPLDKIHFFSLTKDEQLEEITKFIKTAYGEAEKMRIKKE
jgi:hypothetical protein